MGLAPSTPTKRMTSLGMFSSVTAMLMVSRRGARTRFVVGRHLLDLLERGDRGLGRELEEIFLAGDEAGRVGAGGQTLLLDQRELAVGAVLARLAAEFLLERVQDVVAAAQHARDVGAHHED